MRHRRATAFILGLLLLGARQVSADTVRVTVERALVWNKPSGVSVVLTQLPRGTTVDVIRRSGDWYEIVLPVRPGRGADRPGFIRANQVTMATRAPLSTRAARLSTPAARRQRARNPTVLLIDGAARVGSQELTRTSTAFAATYAEEGSIAANYGKAAGMQFSALVGQFVWGAVGIGLGIDYASRTHSASIDATIPHPLYFDQDRPASFKATGLTERQAAVHIPVLWTPPSYGSTKILVFGGPTFFYVSQALVTDLELDDAYPFDTVSVTNALTEKKEASAVGVHAGVDLSYFFSPTIGLGGGVRYSRGTLKFKDDDDGKTEGVAGSLQIAAGVRIRF